MLPRELKIGDDVYCKTIGKNAVVTALKDKKGNVEVAAGMLKMRVKEDSLKLIPKKQEKPKSSSRRNSVESRASKDINNRCDLRGLMVDEALLVLDRFIDDLIMSGLNECTIIHGKGTGALRKGIHDFLKKHPQLALTNSQKYFKLNEVESDIILSHMYPITKDKPKYAESKVVCVSDKLVSYYEFFRYQLNFSANFAFLFLILPPKI